MYVYTYVFRPHSVRPYHILRPRRCVCFVFYTYVCMYTYVCIYVCMYDVCMYVYICTYTYVYVHTCCVLTKPPIPSWRCKDFVVLRPVENFLREGGHPRVPPCQGGPFQTPYSHVFLKFMMLNTSLKKLKKCPKTA